MDDNDTNDNLNLETKLRDIITKLKSKNTEQQESINTLKEELTFKSSLLDNLAEEVLAFDLNGNIFYSNKYADKHTALTSKELIGTSVERKSVV